MEAGFWSRFKTWGLVEILKLKFDLYLCDLVIWLYFGEILLMLGLALNPWVRCAFCDDYNLLPYV